MKTASGLTLHTNCHLCNPLHLIDRLHYRKLLATRQAGHLLLQLEEEPSYFLVLLVGQVNRLLS